MAAISQKTSLNSFFLNENVWISLKISLKFVPMDRINNGLSLGRRQAIIWTDDG